MKLKKLFKLSAIFMMAVGMFVSCTQDFGSDLQVLQSQVSELTAKVEGLEQQINDGAVIVSVDPIDNGVKVMLSNGDSFDIKNGIDGKDGKDGVGFPGAPGKPGTVVTIGDNGNWFLDGEDSGKPSRGENGLDGTNGHDGLNGADGTNGDYFVPCVDKESANYGYWVKVDGTTGTNTVTSDRWLLEGTVTAVWNEDDEVLTFHNVEGAEDGIVEVCLSTTLRSLAVLPETWSAYMGLPEVQIYTLMPMNFGGNWFGKIWINTPGGYLGRCEGDAGNGYMLQSCLGEAAWSSLLMIPTSWLPFVLISTYCSLNNVESAFYNERFDLTKNGVECNWPGYSANWYSITAQGNASYGLGQDYARWQNDMTFGTEDLLKAATQYLDYFEQSFKNAQNEDPWNSWWGNCVPLTTDFSASYRVNPSNANLDGYKFSMVDRSVNVDRSELTKASGDVAPSMVKNLKTVVSKGQIDVTGEIDAFGFLSLDPLEWLEMMAAHNLWGYVPTPGAEGLYVSLKDGYAAAGEWYSMMGYDRSALTALKAVAADKSEIVSDYVYVKNNFVDGVFKSYYSDVPTLAPGNWEAAYVDDVNLDRPNDVMKYTDTYDVASHVRLDDSRYGDLTSLFEGKLLFKYSLEDFGAADKMTIDANTGKLSVKPEYQMVDKLDAILGKQVIVDVWCYFKDTNHPYRYCSYLITIVPDMDKSINVVYDLGDINYTELTAEFNVPRKALLDSLVMSADAFNTFYQYKDVESSIDGYSAVVDMTKDDLIVVSLSEKTKIGPNKVTYNFTANEGYSTIKPATYTVKWNVVNDFPDLVLNPDYILYTDVERTKLDVSDAWNDVDSIIVVKGKRNPNNDDEWIPQSSIKEHLKDYVAYMDINNCDNLSMKLTEARNGKDCAASIIASEETPYELQEIMLKDGYCDWTTQYKDFVVSAYADLANGEEILVKEYIVRFVCPFVLECSDIVLHTHVTDTCSAMAEVRVLEYETNKVLVEYGYNEEDQFQAFITDYAKAAYPNMFWTEQQIPDYELVADKSFNAYPEWGDNLCGGNSKVPGAKQFGQWFYWNNDGTVLQADKTCHYVATLKLGGSFGNLVGKGNITVLSTAHSTAAHSDHVEE